MGSFAAAARRTLREARFPGLDRQSFRATLDRWQRWHRPLDVESYYVLLDTIARMSLSKRNQLDTFSLFDLARNFERDEVMYQAPKDREWFRYLIFKTLRHSLQGSPNRTYLEFGKHVLTAERSAVITLNWDTALEAALARLGLQVDYGLEPRPKARVPSRPSNVPVFKLHGSLDWWSCRRCGRLEIVPGRRLEGLWAELDEKRLRCSSCRAAPLLPLFVPPVSQKFGDQAYARVLAHVWWNALECLTRARRLVFIGYSFPPTDVQFAGFLRNAAAAEETAWDSVEVVNPGKEPFERLCQAIDGLLPPAKLVFVKAKFEESMAHLRWD